MAERPNPFLLRSVKALALLAAVLGTFSMLGLADLSFKPDLELDAVLLVALGATVLTGLVWRQAKWLNRMDEELKRSHEQATELADHLQLLINHAPIRMAMLDRDLRYLWVSQRWLQDFGFEKRQVIGRTVGELFPGLPSRWKDVLARGLQGIVEKRDEDTIECPDGRLDWIRWEIRPWRAPKGEIGGVVVLSENITERKLAQDKLRSLYADLEKRVYERTKELELQSTVVRNMAEGVCLIKAADGAIVYANPKFAQIFGYGPGELEGRHVSILNADDENGYAQEVAKTLASQIMSEGAHTYEIHNARKDGTPFWSQATASVFDHPEFGKILVTVQQDITERKNQETAIRRSEQRYRDVFELAADGIFEADLSCRYVDVNPAGCELLGYRKDEIVGQSIFKFLPKEDHQRLEKAFRTHATGTSIVRAEWFMLRKDGSLIPIEICAKTLQGDRVIAIMRDMTEHKRREDQESFLSQTTSILSETMDYEERIQRTADAVVPKIADVCVVQIVEDGLLHFKAAAARDRKMLDLILHASTHGICSRGPYGTLAAIENIDSILINDLPKELRENPHLDPGFKELASHLNLNSYLLMPLKTRGKTVGTIALGMVSGRKFTSEDLAFSELVATRCAAFVESARLYLKAQQAIAARESVLSIVSHDLRNPVAAIDLAAQLLLDHDLQRQEISSIAWRLRNSAVVMQRLISDLLDFGKIQAGAFSIEKGRVTVTEILALSLESLADKAREKQVLLQAEVKSDLPDLFCDKSRVVQVLWNLVGNAIKFSPRNATVSLSASVQGPCLKFSILDHGPGISPEDLPRVFDRFWQSKQSVTKGTGLGLSIAKGIVEAHGGNIHAESTLGLGSRFEFTVPIYCKQTAHDGQKNAQHEAPSPAAVPAPLDGFHILAVDDSEDNLALLHTVLENAGARVTTAQSAAEALRAIATDRPHAMITDIEMPGGDGYELLKKVHQLENEMKFHLPVAAFTGHSTQEDRRKLDEAGFTACVTKPISAKTLIDSITGLLH